MENERGRMVVEEGALCERKNGRGVDTNRNWQVHWGFREKDYDPAEEFPGTRPFRSVFGSNCKCPPCPSAFSNHFQHCVLGGVCWQGHLTWGKGMLLVAVALFMSGGLQGCLS